MRLIPCVDGTKRVTKEYCLLKCIERRFGCKGDERTGCPAWEGKAK